LMPQRHRFTPEILGQAVAVSESWAAVGRYFGLNTSGGSRTRLRKLAVQWDIDTSHFAGQAWSRGTSSPVRLSPAEILVLGENVRPAAQLRRALCETGRPYRCEECKVGPTWNGRRLVLQVDHRDGNRLNNQPDNIRFLCPNCHSQTENFGIANSRILGRQQRICEDCGRRISRRANRCRFCNQKKVHPVGRFKINWPSDVELNEMVKTTSYSATGRLLGVSATAVRNRHLGGRTEK
jgi:ribosomal protein L40E